MLKLWVERATGVRAQFQEAVHMEHEGSESLLEKYCVNLEFGEEIYHSTLDP